MLLFFVPAMLVVTEYTDLIQHQGLRILGVIVASTACVMAATALAVDRVYRLELWLARRRSTRARLHREQEGTPCPTRPPARPRCWPHRPAMRPTSARTAA